MKLLVLISACVLISATVLGTAVSSSQPWEGPTSGPAAQNGKSVIFIASDLRNGGVAAVSQAFMEAAKVLKWKAEILDGFGERKNIRKQLKEAIKSQPDGIILGGFDSVDYIRYLTAKDSSKIRFVGWHSTSKPGPSKYLFANVTTDPLMVAEVAAKQIQKSNNKHGVGVIIITDRRFSIATAKTLKMKKIIESSPGQHVIAVEDVSISQAKAEMSSLVRTWNQRYGAAWTHTLAINDIYFDYMKDSLEKYNRKDIINIAAGDGSLNAIRRIKDGEWSQRITIAEPLQAQGWQLADELNRAFANRKPSGYVSSLIVVNKKYLDAIQSENVEMKSQAKDQYTKIWLQK
ncbi:MAG: substrate-binding domain-containing protein [Bacillota bacterium]